MTAASCPIGKVPYPSPQAAFRVLAKVQRRTKPRTGHRRHRPGTAYRCPDCGCWHLASARSRR